MRLLLLSLSLLVPAAAGHAAVPLLPGEQLTFRVSWGPFGHAGNIQISAEDDVVDGVAVTRVTTETATRGFIRLLYPFDGQVQSTFDQVTGRLLEANATTRAGRKRTEASIVFDHASGLAHYTDLVRPERSATLEIPERAPLDLITSLVTTRDWQVEPGDRRPLVVLFDDEFYDLTVTAERVETVQTAHGRKPGLLLVPRMEAEPKGMFRRGGEVRVWLSEDDERLPLRLEVAMKVGEATAVLTDYRPPMGTVARVHANPRP